MVRYGLAASLIAACFVSSSTAASPDQWRGRQIYQVLTDRFARTDGSTTAPCDVNANVYCGGTWKGIENKLDYIFNMGFNAVWISPVTKNRPDGYHGYFQTDLYQLNEHFGSAQDLKDLSAALHRRGMYLMVDVVTNHMGASTDDVSRTNYREFWPFNDASFYHPYCPIDYNNQNSAEVCWLHPNLPDLKTEDQRVVNAFNGWISWLVSTYGIDGLRIDSVKDVNKESMPPFCRSAGVYCLGEVSNGDPGYAYPYQQVLNGGGITNYPVYYSFLANFLQSGKQTTAELAYNIYIDSSTSQDSTLHGTFTENHDNARVANFNSDIQVAANAIGFTILTDGIPIIYYGQEQHLSGPNDPGCREAMWLTRYDTGAPLHGTTAYLNQMRNWALSRSGSYLTTKNKVLNYSDTQIAMRKDVVRTILTRAGTSQGRGTYTTVGAGFNANARVIDLISCKTYTANGAGEVTADVGGGVMVVMMEANFLRGSTMCGT